jgi:hypothetical protein
MVCNRCFIDDVDVLEVINVVHVIIQHLPAVQIYG